MGRVVRAWVENNRGMAEVEFDTRRGRGKDFQQGAERDPENHIGAVQSGQLGGSPGRGYIGRRTIYRTMQYRQALDAMEISVVSVPADATVGVGRSSESADTPDLSAYERQIQINQNTFRR